MSTAKSMATSYLNGKRNISKAASNQHKFKSSTSNLSAVRPLFANNNNNTTKSRLKSTSMTNLIALEQQEQATSGQHRIQRPVSRNALDSIHNGMNAKYAQVQSKVYLQNIKPQSGGAPSNAHSPGSKIPAVAKPTVQDSASNRRVAGRATAVAANSERTALLAKLKALEEDAAKWDTDREALKQEIERERQDKADQVQAMKLELQEKIGEQEKRNEEYHQKLLEAYELADQNRRAADSVLSESRQRDEESRKKIEELEGQLGELREFVTMKEEMTGKMYELREQIHEERQRYEEQLKSLHQVFENEKISFQLKGEENNGSQKRTDEKSNYFNRVKPTLQSNESINKLRSSNCRKCESGSSQLHTSEQDMYGSKLSTRMQESARSAWRASKQFASSVITGGVNLSACRQCKRRNSSSSLGSPHAQGANSRVPTGFGPELAAGELEGDHTSIVAVSATSSNPSKLDPAGQQLAGVGQRDEQPAQAASVIRVDANNKLTIVTKFNESDMAVPSSGSERSRCESSSSGRGTSSDAGSNASQHGDEEPDATPSPKAGNPEAPRGQSKETEKRHRRKSSLFKANKVFGGSQVSLNKLKSFFAPKASPTTKNEQKEQQSIEHLESSRLRCLELSQASSINQDDKVSSSEREERKLGQGDEDCKIQAETETEIETPKAQQAQPQQVVCLSVGGECQ